MNVEEMALSFPRKAKALRWEHKHLLYQITGKLFPRRKVHENKYNVW